MFSTCDYCHIQLAELKVCAVPSLSLHYSSYRNVGELEMTRNECYASHQPEKKTEEFYVEISEV